MRKAHIPLEISVLTRIRDQCIQARCTVDGPTPSVYYRGAPYSNSMGKWCFGLVVWVGNCWYRLIQVTRGCRCNQQFFQSCQHISQLSAIHSGISSS